MTVQTKERPHIDFPENTLGCPWCDEEYQCNEDDQHIDDVRDEVIQTCDSCGGKYQLKCIDVTLYFRAYRVDGT